jgi:hypothetical protein
MSWGKFIVCLLIAGAMTYGGYLADLPQTVYIGTGALIFIVAISTAMK